MEGEELNKELLHGELCILVQLYPRNRKRNLQQEPYKPYWNSRKTYFKNLNHYILSRAHDHEIPPLDGFFVDPIGTLTCRRRKLRKSWMNCYMHRWDGPALAPWEIKISVIASLAFENFLLGSGSLSSWNGPSVLNWEYLAAHTGLKNKKPYRRDGIRQKKESRISNTNVECIALLIK